MDSPLGRSGVGIRRSFVTCPLSEWKEFDSRQMSPSTPFVSLRFCTFPLWRQTCSPASHAQVHASHIFTIEKTVKRVNRNSSPHSLQVERTSPSHCFHASTNGHRNSLALTRRYGIKAHPIASHIPPHPSFNINIRNPYPLMPSP